jgi:hypothetical protein
MSACHCHRLCVSHLEEGCKSWKYYEEDGGSSIKHCYLQSSIFGPGEGYYGKTEAKWTDWTSGTPQYRYYKDSFPEKLAADGSVSVDGTGEPAQLKFDRPWLLGVSVDDPAKLATGEPFTLMVSGTGFPYSPSKALDESPLQRVKIVPKGASCAVRVPATVSGISCVKSTKKSMPKVKDAFNVLVDKPETVYTLCGPRPSTTTASGLSLSGVSIMPSTESMDYEVCYCEFDCFDPVRWQKVPGMITTPASTYTWMSEPDVVTRHATDMLGPKVSITVTRPAFGHHSLNDGWTVKLVRDYFSCDLLMDDELFHHTKKSCDGPDVCTFEFEIFISAMDVGRYYVCFDEGMGSSAIPKSPSGEKFLEILEIDPDHSHPRGIFHNQYFSALAGGAATDLEISGYKIPLPSTSRVTITKGVCGDLKSYSFAGELLPPVVADTTPPELIAVTVPAGGVVSTSELVIMTFSERVTLDDCKGNFVFSGPSVVKIPCSNAVAFKDVITLSVENVTVLGQYNLTIETEAVFDLSGNRITYATTGDPLHTTLHGFTISATETAPPTVVRTTPLPGASSADGVISFMFTENIVAGDGLLSLSMCKASCDTHKDLIKNYHVNDINDNTTVTVKGNMLTIDLGPAAKDFAFYELVLATGLVEDYAGNALAMPYALEFFMDSGSVLPTGFDMETSTAKVKLGASSDDPTDSKVVFDFALAAATEPGSYNLCYCNDQTDITLAVLGDSAKTYKLTDNQLCHTKGLFGLDADPDSCVSKCSAGCVGPSCYCEGLPEAEQGALCLPKEDCAAKCTATDGCIGINVHDTLPICYLVEDCHEFMAPTPPALAYNDTWWNPGHPNYNPPPPSNISNYTFFETELVPASYMYFAAEEGTACTQVTDFKERAGTVTVTSRVFVGVDYVVTPSIAQSLEVTGPDLTYDSKELLSKDRIMVIDCGGTCGVSGPTDKVTGYGSVAMWNDLLPHSYFQDAPWDDAHGNDPVNEETPTTPMPTPMGYTYSIAYDSSYYSMLNVDVTAVDDTGKLVEMVAIDGILQPLKKFQCYEMCGSKECVGEWCKCSGYLSGIDGPTSNALCADRATCQYLCDQVDCQAIDMSKSVDRCYLNTLPKKDDGSGEVDAQKALQSLMADAGYQILHQEPPNGPAGRRMMGDEEPAPLLPPMDLGYSWKEILRFKGLTFSTGGTFKLCFCDSTLLGGTATPCLTKKDYAVEVGKVHSSGVSCLLSQPKLQRAACVTMEHGADPKPLRCYSGIPVPPLTPPLLASTSVAIDQSVKGKTFVPPAGTSAGAYSPEEVGVQPKPQSGNAAPPSPR